MNDSEAQLDRIIAAAKQHDQLPPSATDRAWASLAAAVVAGTEPSVPVDIGTGAAATGLGLKGLVIASVTVITAATTAIVASSITSRDRDPVVVARSEIEPEPPRPVNATPQPAMLPMAPAPTAATLAAPVVAAPASPSEDATRGPRRPLSPEVVADVAATEPVASTLAEQARLLGEAWRDLSAGETDRALARLEEHARRFPQTSLHPEREAAKVVAWCQQGKPWAHGQARRFIADHEGTTLAKRVAGACGGGEE
jgi:hypothetical protein